MEYRYGRRRAGVHAANAASNLPRELYSPPCFVLQETIASLESKNTLAAQEMESYRYGKRLMTGNCAGHCMFGRGAGVAPVLKGQAWSTL